MGPALLPENLGRLKKTEALEVIRAGRAATQMPGFADKLADEDIAALVELIYTPLPQRPAWGVEAMHASHKVFPHAVGPSDRPVFDGDPLNLFVVVELGDHHITILDGDRFEPLARLPTRYALHGGPKFSPDGRYVYLASRDGWISKLDLWNLGYVAEIRAGINTRNLAVSSDGRLVAVGNYLPHTLVILDAADLKPLEVIAVRDDAGRSSRVSAVYDAGPRQSFIAALKDLPEVWEIPYRPDQGPRTQGRAPEGLAERGLFALRRIRLDEVLDDFFFDPNYAHLIGASRDGAHAQVVNLDAGRKIATLDLPGMPHLGSGITWDYRGTPVLATPHLKQGAVTVVDLRRWKTLARIATLGPGFFLRSHERTPYAWVDNMMSAHKDILELIDKRTLKVAHRLRPAPGRTAAHVEFTRDGRYALVSIWEDDGALVVYDAYSLKEVKRLPMRKPSGKYNVYNKITRSAGTSH